MILPESTTFGKKLQRTQGKRLYSETVSIAVFHLLS